jgi:hypothetical protein
VLGGLLVAAALLAPAAAGADAGGAKDEAGRGGGAAADLSVAAVPGNDDFADAQTISGGAGTLASTVVDATVETGEPDPFGTNAEHSIWFEWTAPADGSVSFDTESSDIDTILAAHTGTTVGELAEVAANDDSGSLHSRITFSATNGTTYAIQLLGFDDWEGLVALTWDQDGTAPSNDDFADGRVLADNDYDDGLLGYQSGFALVMGSSESAGSEAGEPTHITGGGRTVWFSWTAGYTDAVSFELSDGGGWDGAPFAYTGGAVGALIPVTDADAEEQDLLFDAVAGTTYHIVIDGFEGGGDEGGGGEYELRWARRYPAPANDDLADAHALTGASGTIDGTTIGATDEDGEAERDGSVPERSIWYSWTAPASGPLQIDTWDSPYLEDEGDLYPPDTVLGVYTGGPGVGDLDEVTADDEFPDEVSRVRFDAVAGTTYLVAVDDDADWPGIDVTLTWGPNRSWFPDVSPTHPFAHEIDWMLEREISEGYEDGTFRPAGRVSRQAMSAFMYRLDGYPDVDEPTQPSFLDVPFDHPFSYEIEWMNQAEISTGYSDGTFRPDASVTRQAMSAFMYRLADEPTFVDPATPSFSDVGPAHPFFHEIEWMAAEEISTGYTDGTFKPSAPVTRQAMSAFLFRLDALLNPPPP